MAACKICQTSFNRQLHHLIKEKAPIIHFNPWVCERGASVKEKRNMFAATDDQSPAHGGVGLMRSTELLIGRTQDKSRMSHQTLLTVLQTLKLHFL